MNWASKAREIWVHVLDETPLQVRRRASSYLKNIRKISDAEWVVRGSGGFEYRVRIERKGQVTCSCPFFKSLGEGYCKHICAVAASELVKMEILPRLGKLLEEKL